MSEAELTPIAKMRTLGAQHALMVRVGTDPADPYPHLAAARRRTPVLCEENDSPAGMGVLALSHAAVQTLLRDGHRFSSNLLTEALGPSTANARLLVSLDDPEHRVQRALVSQAFSGASITALAESLMAPIVDGLLDVMVSAGDHGDLVEGLCFAFPAQVIAAMLGLPPADFERFQGWTADIVGHLTAPERAATALRELRACVDERIEAARRDPAGDIIAALVGAEIEGRRLTGEQIFTFVRMLLPAGVETTYRAIGNMLACLLSHEDQLAAVLRDVAGLSSRVVEESLRYEVPMLVTNRVAAIDCELEGVAIPRHAGVLAVVAAANRDESRYPDPDRFDILRDPVPHVSFGTGPHLCLGLHLARTEMRVALERLLMRLPSVELTVTPQIEGIVFRSPAHLPVRW